MKKSILTSDSGFTLIEILIASAISSIMILMIYTAYKTTLHTIKDMTGYAEFYENINLAIYKIDRDISNIYINRENKNVSLVCEPAGDSSTINFVSSKNTSMSVFGSVKNASPVGDIREVGYSVKQDKRTTGLFILIRREQNHYDDEPDRGGFEDVLLENVVSAKFELRLHNDWIDKWDSKENRRFPEAYKITLNVKNYKGKEEEFSFISIPGMK